MRFADAKSKTLAERAAWDFVRALPAHKTFELATVCPGLILGYPLGGGAFSSGDVVRKVRCSSHHVVVGSSAILLPTVPPPPLPAASP